MCGIGGYFDLTGTLGEDELHFMNSRMMHRGPDSGGTFIHGPAGLAHRRLSILDLSPAGNQPMNSQCGRYTIVYNGEIYNFRELLEQIRTQDPSFSPVGTSDTEVILQAFVLWGRQFTDRLNGMFAMAIYDRLEQAIFLLRDRAGIKPLYYFFDEKRFVFASELNALGGLGKLSGTLTIDQEAICSFLHLGYIPAPLSIFKQIRKLEAGTCGRIDKNGLKLEKWWSAQSSITPESIKDKQQALQQLESLLESSVGYRLISDVPYGSFLSGGIDSSLVTSIAQKVNPAPLNTFTIGFQNNSSFNEAHFAKQIATHLGTNHHELFISEKETLEWLPTFFDTYQEPFADSSGIPTLLISHFARKQVTMALSGDGGDELFLGYGAYQWARRLRHNLPGWTMAIASKALMMGDQRMQRASWLFNHEGAPTLKSHIFSQEQYCFSRKEIRELLLNSNKEFGLHENFPTLARPLGADEQQALFDINYYLPDDLLVKVDRATMASSLEARVPLLDYRIMEFALNLHPSLKYRNGSSKWLLKELLKKYIPESLFDRPKKGFSIPLNQWLQKELKFLAGDYLSPQAVIKTGIFDPPTVNRLLKDFYVYKNQYQYQKVWLLIVLQKWMTGRQL